MFINNNVIVNRNENNDNSSVLQSSIQNEHESSSK